MFPQTVLPRDFDTIEIPFPERGEPGADPLGRDRHAGRGRGDRGRGGRGVVSTGHARPASRPSGMVLERLRLEHGRRELRPAARPAGLRGRCGRGTSRRPRPRCSTAWRPRSRTGTATASACGCCATARRREMVGRGGLQYTYTAGAARRRGRLGDRARALGPGPRHRAGPGVGRGRRSSSSACSRSSRSRSRTTSPRAGSWRRRASPTSGTSSTPACRTCSTGAGCCSRWRWEETGSIGPEIPERVRPAGAVARAGVTPLGRAGPPTPLLLSITSAPLTRSREARKERVNRWQRSCSTATICAARWCGSLTRLLRRTRTARSRWSESTAGARCWQGASRR